MAKTLTQVQIERYKQTGCIYPIRVLSDDDVNQYRTQLDGLQALNAAGGRQSIPHKPYLQLTWLAELVRNPRILDAVEDLIGEDILCWNANFFIKEGRTPAHVTWHQDSTYFGLSSTDVVTAWIALTDSVQANGAMQFIPGSHVLDQLPHRETLGADNLLSRGQEIMVDVDKAKSDTISLKAGEMSLHHCRLVHNSPPNASEHRRVGFAVRYIPTSIKQTLGEDSATLVRGQDRYHHFNLEPRPARDFDPDVSESYRKVMANNAKALYRAPAAGRDVSGGER
ncbi:phytanoyl-CoA dioxygenase family protein [Bradyrhizobium sp. 149]|uniref:phytanoyl-CoA dioxygenase family protein n=1 Tax=Bradyrhizobium sp. 149 TaxID=2782624 RepID=UPI001FFC2087|nr:phytanoyl-CoA dioxygenase family protein [Bradyrhizobium sp. 149]MCK1652943.1 phytanoyl-CoA dioxygenase family protein [Bradyrhizobium sp. 149]